MSAADELQASSDRALAEHIARRIRGSQRQLATPDRLEQALVSAFQFLGLEADHIGGIGATEILIHPIQVGGDKLLVDVQVSADGRVRRNDVSWPTVVHQRQLLGAGAAIVVGESFEEGVAAWAWRRYQVGLVSTETICELLRGRARGSVSIEELVEALGAPPASAAIALTPLALAREQAAQRARAIRQVALARLSQAAAMAAGRRPVGLTYGQLVAEADIAGPSVARRFERVDANLDDDLTMAEPGRRRRHRTALGRRAMGAVLLLASLLQVAVTGWRCATNTPRLQVSRIYSLDMSPSAPDRIELRLSSPVSTDTVEVREDGRSLSSPFALGPSPTRFMVSTDSRIEIVPRIDGGAPGVPYIVELPAFTRQLENVLAVGQMDVINLRRVTN